MVLRIKDSTQSHRDLESQRIDYPIFRARKSVYGTMLAVIVIVSVRFVTSGTKMPRRIVPAKAT